MALQENSRNTISGIYSYHNADCVSQTSVNGDIGLEIGSIRVMRFSKRDGSFDDHFHNE